ncbi:MAG: SprT family zinc-dependent metalloprotease [Polyangiaceae bacterium]
MTTEPHSLSVSGLRVAVVRKAIRNLHLGVYPPDGRVRVAVPLAVSDAAVRVAVIGRLRWIRRQQAAFAAQPREPERDMVSGESHYFLGRRYLLEVSETGDRGAVGVNVKNRRVLEMRVRPGTDAPRRAALLQRWYREQLRELVPALITKWEKRLGVSLAEWGIKRMKTKWGSCNAKARRIWLNLELAKKPLGCIEYIVVHELAHLKAKKHDDRFVKLMDEGLPQWRHTRKLLNAAPLASETWRG